MDDYQNAISDYSEVIRLEPGSAEAFNNRGIAYQKRGDRAKADSDFARAKELGHGE